MNLLTLSQIQDFSENRVMIPISGGINSAAVLCFIAEKFPEEFKPDFLFLYYTHLEEHSPETLRFVRDLFAYSRKKFRNIKFGYNRASVNEFFISQNMIPHPSLSPCSTKLKIEPQLAEAVNNQIDIQLVGYVKNEMRRYRRAKKFEDRNPVKVEFPILEFSEDDCFDLVKKFIGWYPSIYDIRWTRYHFEIGLCTEKQIGKRVFLHNNCLPCKNMSEDQLRAVAYFFPVYAKRAMETQQIIPNAYWGRDDIPDIFKCDICERFN